MKKQSVHSAPLASISRMISGQPNAQTTGCERDARTGIVDVWFCANNDAYQAIIRLFAEQYDGYYRFIDCGFNIRILHIENFVDLIN